MKLLWTSKAASDLARLHEFLAAVNRPAADRALQALVAAPERLLAHPRLGESVEGFEGREIRRLVVGAYQLRYEVQANTIYLLRIWHSRESR